MTEAQTKKIKIGFVGVGDMGQCAHLKNFATLPDCEVVALAESRPELGKRVAARYGVPRVYRTHTEMFAREKPDGIVAIQPFGSHGALIPEFLKAAAPLLIEKPLAGSLPTGAKIIKALAASGTWIMVGYHKRSDPATIYAKETVARLQASGEIGKLKYVRILMPAGDWSANGFADLIDSDEPRPPANPDPPDPALEESVAKLHRSFVNYYIHQVNLMRHLLGEPYRVVYADPSGVMLAGRSASGVACVIEMSPYCTTLDWNEEALVAFEKGYVRLELPAPLASNRPGRVEVFKDPGNGKTPETMSPTLPWIHAMRQQAMNFLAAIRGERKPPCAAAEALEDLKIAGEYIRLLQSSRAASA